MTNKVNDVAFQATKITKILTQWPDKAAELLFQEFRLCHEDSKMAFVAAMAYELSMRCTPKNPRNKGGGPRK
jgi:hypothetical protein